MLSRGTKPRTIVVTLGALAKSWMAQLHSDKEEHLKKPSNMLGGHILKTGMTWLPIGTVVLLLTSSPAEAGFMSPSPDPYRDVPQQFDFSAIWDLMPGGTVTGTDNWTVTLTGVADMVNKVNVEAQHLKGPHPGVDIDPGPKYSATLSVPALSVPPQIQTVTATILDHPTNKLAISHHDVYVS